MPARSAGRRMLSVSSARQALPARFMRGVGSLTRRTAPPMPPEAMSSQPITTIDGASADTTSPVRDVPARCPNAWPIGAMIATHWLAHRSGPSPDGDDVFEAVGLGLIDDSAGWSVTARGQEALREHGWL